MKLQFILACILFIILIGCTPTNNVSNGLTEADKKIAKGLIQGAFDDLWAAGDTTKIGRYHTEDFIILEQGSIWDNDRIKKYMLSLHTREKPVKRINKMDYITIEKYGASMQIAYWNEADFFQQDSLVGSAKWLESALAIETDEGWRLKMMHSTGVFK